MSAGGRALLAAAAAWALMANGCGYRVAGRADLLPKNIKTIAIPAFANATSRSKLPERLAAALAREFITRTRYEIVADPNQADAVLTGTVINYAAYPTVFDPASGRASGVQVGVNVSIRLQDRASGAILYSRDNVEFRERYEISVDQRVYLEEADPALERLSRDVARTIVSAVLEGF